jgi:hypothetical protein
MGIFINPTKHTTIDSNKIEQVWYYSSNKILLMKRQQKIRRVMEPTHQQVRTQPDGEIRQGDGTYSKSSLLQ